MLLTPTTTGDFLVAAIVGLVAWHYYRSSARGRWMLLEPINAFWAGILMCYVLQPVEAGKTFVSWHSLEIFNKTLFATFFGLCFVLLGYGLRPGATLVNRLPQLPQRLSSSRLLMSACVFTAAGLFGYARIISASGGLYEWLDVGRGGTDYEKVHGYWPMLTTGLPAGVMLLFFRTRFHKVSWPEKFIAWAAVAGILWWYIYLGSRSQVIGLVVTAVAAYYLPIRRSPSWALILPLLLSVYIVVKFQENFRSNFTHLSLNLDKVDKGELLSKLLPTFIVQDRDQVLAEMSKGAEFNCAMAVVELVPETVPFNYGYGFLEILTRPIPRTVWPSKPHPHLESVQGVLREGQLSDAVLSNASSSELLMGPALGFVGHWYYVGGFVGLVIGGLLTGTILRLIRAFHDRSAGAQGTILIYAFLLHIGFAEAASTPWYWVYTLPFVLLPVIGVIYFCRESVSAAAVRPAANRNAQVVARRPARSGAFPINR